MLTAIIVGGAVLFIGWVAVAVSVVGRRPPYMEVGEKVVFV